MNHLACSRKAHYWSTAICSHTMNAVTFPCKGEVSKVQAQKGSYACSILQLDKIILKHLSKLWEYCKNWEANDCCCTTQGISNSIVTFKCLHVVYVIHIGGRWYHVYCSYLYQTEMGVTCHHVGCILEDILPHHCIATTPNSNRITRQKVWNTSQLSSVAQKEIRCSAGKRGCTGEEALCKASIGLLEGCWSSSEPWIWFSCSGSEYQSEQWFIRVRKWHDVTGHLSFPWWYYGWWEQTQIAVGTGDNEIRWHLWFFMINVHAPCTPIGWPNIGSYSS